MSEPLTTTPTTPHIATQGFVPYLFECLCGWWSLRAIGWGIALGVLLGFLPKTNLTAALVFLTIYFSAANTVAAVFACALAIPLAVILSQVAIIFGEWLRALPLPIDAATCVETIPLVAWLGFDSSLVVGQLAIGGILAVAIAITTEVMVRIK